MGEIKFRAGTTVYQVVSTGMAFRGTVIRQVAHRCHVRWTDKRRRGQTDWEKLEKGPIVRGRDLADNLSSVEPAVVS